VSMLGPPSLIHTTCNRQSFFSWWWSSNHITRQQPPDAKVLRTGALFQSLVLMWCTGQSDGPSVFQHIGTEILPLRSAPCIDASIRISTHFMAVNKVWIDLQFQHQDSPGATSRRSQKSKARFISRRYSDTVKPDGSPLDSKRPVVLDDCITIVVGRMSRYRQQQ